MGGVWGVDTLSRPWLGRESRPVPGLGRRAWPGPLSHSSSLAWQQIPGLERLTGAAKGEGFNVASGPWLQGTGPLES